MTSTSATGGFLRLTPDQGPDDLEDALHSLVAGITRLPGEMVRPRWQPDPPRTPEKDVDWCAFGVTQYEPSNLPVLIHHGHHGEGEGEAFSEIKDTEELLVTVSFYGPRHMVAARMFRRGIYVPQNRAGLRSAGLTFVKAGTIVPVPEAVALGWLARADVPVSFRLETFSRLEILSLKSCGGCGSFLETDTGVIASLEACRKE